MSNDPSELNDQAHHRRHLNLSSLDAYLEEDSKDSLKSNSPEFPKQSNPNKATDYRKKYDIELSRDHFVKRNTFLTQSKALLEKNLALQAKQKGTNLCQILIPISCLIVTLVFKMLAKQELQKVYTFDIQMPYFFNIPYAKVYNQSVSLVNQSVHVMMSTCLEWYLFDFHNNSSQETIDYLSNKDENLTSFLDYTLPEFDNSREFYFCPQENKGMPYFKKVSNGTINEQIYWGLQYINSQPFDDDVDIPSLGVIPDGAITFYKAHDEELSFRIQINDVRLPEYHRGNGVTKIYLLDPQNNTSKNTMRVTDGQMILLDLMSRAYLHKHNPNIILVSGSQYMPFTTSEETLILKIMSILGATLYPVALSIIFPVFLYSLVLEKEEKLREMMKMNGMKMKNYWIVNYIWNSTLFAISSIFFVFFGIFILKLPFFLQTNIWVLSSVIVAWGLCQVSLAFFFQNFLTKVRTATIMGYLLSIWTCIIAISFNVGIYPYPNRLPMVMQIYPPFAFCRLIYRLSIKCSNFVCARGWFDFDDEMKECLFILYASAVIFMILGVYLDKILPQEFGVTKHPLYFLLSWIKRKKEERLTYLPYTEISIENKERYNYALELSEEDEDVQTEKEFVNKLHPPFHEYPLLIKNIRKVYKAVGGRPKKVAVKDVSFHIKKGEIFGLLGPNGAGKTSLISMLTGLYPPEAGNAWIGGYDIVNQIDLVHSHLGVCPQFDLLWPELTVEEHLLFYARIRGVSKENEQAVVADALRDVRLTKFAKLPTKQLSGGMKRRLSVSIAFVGDPQIILLDEPTTGLDPENRRSLWDILVAARRNRAMVLTTHSMDEADILCTRIGIIVSGSLKCIGPQTRLKSKFGGGYQLVIHCHKDKYLNTYTHSENSKGGSDYYHEKVLEYIKSMIPSAILKSAFHGSFMFQIPIEGLEVSKVFDELELKKEELAISDWGISQCTLEDVFMEIVKFAEEMTEN